MQTNEMLKHFNDVLEKMVMEIFKKKTIFYAKEKMKETKSKNKIPKHVRALMFRKANLSRKVMKSLNWQKTYKIMKEIEDLEENLQANYKSQIWKQEKEVIAEIKKNPKFFYSYSKKTVETQIG